MYSILKLAILAAAIAGHLAQAGEGRGETPTAADSRHPELVATLAEEPSPATERVPRVTAELLVGGMGAVLGGITSYEALSDPWWNSPSRGLLKLAAMMGSMALGACVGTGFVGELTYPNGNVLPLVLGTLGGSALSLLLVSQAHLPFPSGLALLGGLPLAGSIVGYEVGLGAPARSFGALPMRVMPTLSLTSDGRGAAAGVAGTF